LNVSAKSYNFYPFSLAPIMMMTLLKKLPEVWKTSAQKKKKKNELLKK